MPQDIQSWCKQIPAEKEGKYPIDQSDGGEDDDLKEHEEWAGKLETLGRNPRAPWKAQSNLLEIRADDYISDKGEEIWSVLEHKGIDNVILLGVHTNMCVLGRPFGLRQMAKNKKNVVLMRDLTDTMYNPARWPYVSHFTGTDLIVDHIEKYVCPTITSDQILGGEPFRFAGDKRLHLLVVMAESQHGAQETLPEFAVTHLGKSFRLSFVHASPDNRHELPGINALRQADVVLFNVERRFLPREQMALVKEYLAQGKPLVALRTANHPFWLESEEPQGNLVAWREFDAEILGGNYTGEHAATAAVSVRLADSELTGARIAGDLGAGTQIAGMQQTDSAGGHPILSGVDPGKLRYAGSLYKVRPLKKTTTTLLIGSVADHPPEPIAWTHLTRAGGRVFYTSLGHADDFKEPAFSRLVRNAVYWAARLPNGK